jgi:hypothetical protein
MKARRRFLPIRKSFAKGMADDSARPVSEKTHVKRGKWKSNFTATILLKSFSTESWQDFARSMGNG